MARFGAALSGEFCDFAFANRTFAQMRGICRENRDCEETVALDMIILHVGADL
jgi:hypothetical protein